jgi:hypothetical protein
MPRARASSSLSQPGLKERFLARLGKLVDVLLHAGLDPALAGRNLTAKPRDVGFARAENCSSTRTHLLCHRTRCGEQHDRARSQDALLDHSLPPSSSLSRWAESASIPPIARHYCYAGPARAIVSHLRGASIAVLTCWPPWSVARRATSRLARAPQQRAAQRPATAASPAGVRLSPGSEVRQNQHVVDQHRPEGRRTALGALPARPQAPGAPGPCTVISMRRFCARPCGVSFGATGCVSPNPLAEMMFGLTPCDTR